MGFNSSYWSRFLWAFLDKTVNWIVWIQFYLANCLPSDSFNDESADYTKTQLPLSIEFGVI